MSKKLELKSIIIICASLIAIGIITIILLPFIPRSHSKRQEDLWREIKITHELISLADQDLDAINDKEMNSFESRTKKRLYFKEIPTYKGIAEVGILVMHDGGVIYYGIVNPGSRIFLFERSKGFEAPLIKTSDRFQIRMERESLVTLVSALREEIPQSKDPRFKQSEGNPR